jgi:hypothetical protein
MRNKTEPRTRKQTASSPNDSGLIDGANALTQSARAKRALDNRSHRTFQGCVPKACPGAKRRARARSARRGHPLLGEAQRLATSIAP